MKLYKVLGENPRETSTLLAAFTSRRKAERFKAWYEGADVDGRVESFFGYAVEEVVVASTLKEAQRAAKKSFRLD